MIETQESYFQLLHQLFPPGPAFDLDLQPDLAQLLGALSRELARVDTNAESLLLELNPATATSMLPVWEFYLGLPDLLCVGTGPQTPEDRRAAILNQLTATGAPQLSYYRSLGLQSGIPLEIEEFRPTRIGSISVGEFLYDDAWSWSWLASASALAYGTAAAKVLNCRLQRDCPQYTRVVLGFGNDLVASIALGADKLFNAVHYIMPAAWNRKEVH